MNRDFPTDLERSKKIAQAFMSVLTQLDASANNAGMATVFVLGACINRMDPMARKLFFQILGPAIEAAMSAIEDSDNESPPAPNTSRH